MINKKLLAGNTEVTQLVHKNSEKLRIGDSNYTNTYTLQGEGPPVMFSKNRRLETSDKKISLFLKTNYPIYPTLRGSILTYHNSDSGKTIETKNKKLVRKAKRMFKLIKQYRQHAMQLEHTTLKTASKNKEDTTKKLNF